MNRSERRSLIAQLEREPLPCCSARIMEAKVKVLKGAGVLVIAEDTGRILLMQRSGRCSEPGTWCIPGGGRKPNESARDTAMRELEEEAGYNGDIQLSQKPVFVLTKPDIVFSTFVGYVDTEFDPTLNAESTDSGWFDTNNLPDPMHYGVVELLDSVG